MSNAIIMTPQLYRAISKENTLMYYHLIKTPLKVRLREFIKKIKEAFHYLIYEK